MPALSLSNVNYGSFSHSAALPNGGYVFVAGSGGAGVGVNASAIYSSNGSLIASDFIQGGISTGLAVLTDGRIVVVGPGSTSVPSTASTGNVFSSAGQSLGNFSVSRGFSTLYLDQSIAANNNGGFVVGYIKASSYSSAGLGLDGFDSSLSRVWAITLAPETNNRTSTLKLSIESGTGRIAAAWITNDQNPSIKWALLDSAGQTIKPEQTISVPTGGNGGGLHALTWLTGNRLVITFNDAQGQAQYAQFFDNSGNSLSSLVRVSQDAPLSGGVSGSITPPSVTELSSGNLVFAWQSIRTDGSTDVRIRITNSQGSPLGDERVVSPLLGNQLNPMVVAQGGNTFALLWVDAANSTPVLNSMIVDASSPSNLVITAGNTGSFSLESTLIVSAQSSSSSYVSALNPICFTRGTHIQIGEQSKPVETLSISNQISTTKASAAVKWIGYQRRTPEFAAFQDYLPVKISAGALDENLPLRDLYLSPDHAVLVDGHLIHAKALVNGKTIVQMTEWEGDIEYYHIETEAHEIIYAEGVPCETFIDNVSREQFDNYAEYQALYPNTRMMKELPLPRVKFKRQLPLAIKQRLESRIIELDRQHSFI